MKEKKSIIDFLKNIYKRLVSNKPRFNTLEIIIIVIMALAVGLFAGEIVFSKGILFRGNIKEIESVYETLLNEYYQDISDKDLTEAAINGMMNLLGDDYSFYMDEDVTESFNEQLSGTFVGVGVVINKKNKEDLITINKVFPNSPAEKAGIKINDQFVKINGEDVTKLNTDEISNKIKGELGKNFKFILRRDGKDKEFNVITAVVDITSVEGEVIEKNGKKIGYLSISIFASNTDKQFTKELEKLEKAGIDSLIIDVRSNSGGHLDTVTNILKLFFNKKEVMYQMKNKTKTTKYYGTKSNDRNYKVVVLVDSYSASASEVLAVAFKEGKNSDIVGTKTFGKGTVQKTMTLSNGTMIKYTAETWLSPKGNSIDKVGIEPTMEVKLSDAYIKNPGKSTDDQLKKAVETLAK